MKKSAMVVLIYGFLVFSGGLMGCFIAQSIPSLIAGVVFGTLILFNSYRIYKGHTKALTQALIQAIVLGSFFIYRLKMTGKFFPAAIMITISFVVAIVLLFAHPIESRAKNKLSEK